jgi:penicillin-binding protein 1C
VTARRKRLARGALGLGIALAVAYGGWRAYRRSAGDPSVMLDETWHEGTRVLDRQGRLLRELPGPSGNRGRSLSRAEMGDRIVLATIVSEDRGFYEHEGVSPLATLRAAAQNVVHARLVSGASTITQQLVKLLDHEGKPRPRSLAEKLREAARAQNLEEVVSKDTILEAYLNRLSYGHGLVGPEAAAQGYFGVPARELSWARAAFLAVLPRAPSFLDPYTHPERVLLRQRALLEALQREGVIDVETLARALSEPVAARPIERPFLAPHFVEALRDDLEAAGEGRAIVTTLDLDLQRDAEGMVRTHLASIEDRGARNAAAIVIDNATGDVLAYVGSADFSNEKIDGQVDMIQALRQPGSTLKPFVYELAFERGHDSAEMLPDVPTTFGSTAQRTYTPLNFTGTFEGPVSAREALAGSLNVPVVRLLAEIGPADMLARLRDLGFASLTREPAYYGLALALGSGEVRLREVAAAYVALARGGEAIALRTRAADPEPHPRRVMPPEMAASIAEVLADPLARVRGLHGQGPFDVGFPVAVKTGTSAGYRDTLCAGFTRERTVVVWVGNADGAPTHELTGATGAGPLFADVVRRAMRNVASRAPLYDPALLEEAEVCPLSGKRPGPACPDHADRKFPRGHVPKETCSFHVRAVPFDPRAEAEASRPEGSVAMPADLPPTGRAPWRCDPRGERTIVLLPDTLSDWLRMEPLGAPGKDPFGMPWFPRASVPGCESGSHEPAEVAVTSPANGSVLLVSNQPPGSRSAMEVRASVTGGDGRLPRAVDFFLDGKLVARSPWPYTTSLRATPGEHELVALPSSRDQPARVQASRFTVW